MKIENVKAGDFLRGIKEMNGYYGKVYYVGNFFGIGQSTTIWAYWDNDSYNEVCPERIEDVRVKLVDALLQHRYKLVAKQAKENRLKELGKGDESLFKDLAEIIF